MDVQAFVNDAEWKKAAEAVRNAKTSEERAAALAAYTQAANASDARFKAVANAMGSDIRSFGEETDDLNKKTR